MLLQAKVRQEKKLGLSGTSSRTAGTEIKHTGKPKAKELGGKKTGLKEGDRGGGAYRRTFLNVIVDSVDRLEWRDGWVCVRSNGQRYQDRKERGKSTRRSHGLVTMKGDAQRGIWGTGRVQPLVQSSFILPSYSFYTFQLHWDFSVCQECWTRPQVKRVIDLISQT